MNDRNAQLENMSSPELQIPGLERSVEFNKFLEKYPQFGVFIRRANGLLQMVQWAFCVYQNGGEEDIEEFLRGGVFDLNSTNKDEGEKKTQKPTFCTLEQIRQNDYEVGLWLLGECRRLKEQSPNVYTDFSRTFHEVIRRYNEHALERYLPQLPLFKSPNGANLQKVYALQDIKKETLGAFFGVNFCSVFPDVKKEDEKSIKKRILIKDRVFYTREQLQSDDCVIGKRLIELCKKNTNKSTAWWGNDLNRAITQYNSTITDTSQPILPHLIGQDDRIIKSIYELGGYTKENLGELFGVDFYEIYPDSKVKNGKKEKPIKEVTETSGGNQEIPEIQCTQGITTLSSEASVTRVLGGVPSFVDQAMRYTLPVRPIPSTVSRRVSWEDKEDMPNHHSTRPILSSPARVSTRTVPAPVKGKTASNLFVSRLSPEKKIEIVTTTKASIERDLRAALEEYRKGKQVNWVTSEFSFPLPGKGFSYQFEDPNTLKILIDAVPENGKEVWKALAFADFAKTILRSRNNMTWACARDRRGNIQTPVQEYMITITTGVKVRFTLPSPVSLASPKISTDKNTESSTKDIYSTINKMRQEFANILYVYLYDYLEQKESKVDFEKFTNKQFQLEGIFATRFKNDVLMLSLGNNIQNSIPTYIVEALRDFETLNTFSEEKKTISVTSVSGKIQISSKIGDIDVVFSPYKEEIEGSSKKKFTE